MGKWIHLSVCGSWATINIKDLIFTSIIILPWIASVFLPHPFCWVIRCLSLFFLWYEPAQLVFPSNIITSLLLRGQPPVFSDRDKNRLFPNCSLFEGNQFQTIKDELTRISHESIPLTRDALPNQNYIGSESKWRLLPIKTVGKVHEKNAAQVPTLMSIIQRCPEVATVFYSKLEGGSHIPSHAGYLKGVLRYHLGIEIPEPEKCWIKVDQMTVHWDEGESILFDDMYLHSVTHQGTKIRSILWLDIVRNDLDFCPLWKWWTKQLITIISKSHWMQQANARTEQVHRIIK
jgi:aspartyl/asparaginyl beta-hydroxylase (cupin superfamily)